MRFRFAFVCCLMLALFAGHLRAPRAQTRPARADAVWIEGEEPTTKNNDAATFSGWGNKQYLSGEKWLNLAVDEADVPQKLPKEGALFSYDFQAPAGRREVWAHIGYEFVRSFFQWRIDQGAWQDVKPTNLTTDLMDIAVWCEVAWLKLGDAELSAGKHTLQVRIPPTTPEGKAQRALFACDCFCLSAEPFHPNGPVKPGADWQSESDRAAAQQVFAMKAPAGAGERAEVALAGNWQVTRYDEGLVEDRLGPIKALPEPAACFWKGIAVPGDKNTVRPELIFCHRLLYRTRVDVPAGLQGRSFVLRLPSFNMAATVFVNGVLCGSSKTAFAIWDCDVTKAIRPGQVNEVCVGIKDIYYGMTRARGNDNPRYGWNIPLDMVGRNQGVSMTFDMPVCTRSQAGLLEAPVLSACGPAYTADVFAIPSVKRKELGLEVALANPAGAPVSLKVENEVVPLTGGAAQKTFAAKDVTVPAGGQQTLKLAEGWPNPKLWWPDDPQQYLVVTKLSRNGQVLDVKRTKFGFREWEWDGPQLKLNGVPWQGRADLVGHNTSDPEEAVKAWHQHGQTMMRFWGDKWGGLGQEAALDFMDKNGVCVRRSGVFDGEFASYGLSEEVVKDGKKERVANRALFDNWREVMEAQVRGERNHPSIFVWSIENEIAFINSRNLGQIKWAEPELTRCAREVMALDPTRPAMTDGGRCLMDESLPINGCHYDETDFRDYPDEAYTLAKESAAKNPWTLVRERPIFMGESFFARGYPPAAFAAIGGESAFLGRAETKRPVGLYAKMLSEGYRWAGVAAFHYWFADDGDLHYNSWQPVCVLCRQWNWTFGGGETVKRTLKVFNDTHTTSPIEMGWQFVVGGKVLQQGKQTFPLGAGLSQETEIEFKTPPAGKRTPAKLVLTCSRDGKEVFREVKDAWLIAQDGGPKPAVAKAGLLVLDPNGSAKARLKARGIPFTDVARFEDLPDKAQVVLVGQDALTPRQATDPKWRALAAGGARILVLDQANPLHFQAVPADFEVTDRVGRVAFPENGSHPIFAGLDDPDFFTWSKDHVVYRNVYKKATRGALSLVQCDDELGCSAIASCTVNDGLMLLCQMVVGEKLAYDPVAQRLFDNMLAYCAGYKPVRKRTAVALDEASPAGKLLAGSGLHYDKAGDALQAISDGQHDIVIADATPENLAKLAGQPAKVKAFAARGGWLMLWGLDPKGLADFNKLVGVDHLIRPFEMEKVFLPVPRDPLTAGLTMRDVAMESGQKIMPQAGDRFIANDVFTYVVDTDNIAPFCEIPGPEHWNEPGEKPGFDHWPRNMVNGFTSADSWKYCFSILLFKGETTKWTMTLPRPEEIEEFSVAFNAIYHKVTKFSLVFDGDEAHPEVFDAQPGGERQDFALKTPRKAKSITISLLQWEKSGKNDVVGVDNLWIRVRRSPEFRQRVKPLLNIGALVKYPMGEGGIVLNNLRVMERESVPANAQKKAAIVSTILRNLGAVFGGGREVVAGAGMTYEPVPLDDSCNQFLTADRGWWEKPRDLSHFPVGENRFAGVTYRVRDFRTSPLASCVMLAGPGVNGPRPPREVTGIKVGKKADALFFLHTYKRTGEWRPRGRGDQTPPAIFRYVVHYADGQTADVPVLYGEGAENWIQKEPAGLKSASLAWAAPFPNDTSGDQAVVYQMQWNNPRPDVEIASVDLGYDPAVGSRYGVPALLGLSVGRVAK